MSCYSFILRGWKIHDERNLVSVLEWSYKICALPGPGAALVPLRGREGEDAALELVSLVLEWELATGKEGSRISVVSMQLLRCQSLFKVKNTIFRCVLHCQGR